MIRQTIRATNRSSIYESFKASKIFALLLFFFFQVAVSNSDDKSRPCDVAEFLQNTGTRTTRALLEIEQALSVSNTRDKLVICALYFNLCFERKITFHAYAISLLDADAFLKELRAAKCLENVVFFGRAHTKVPPDLLARGFTRPFAIEMEIHADCFEPRR